MFNARILCAGFGGQGVMSLGQLLAYGGMIEGREVSWFPSYGPEMRGGTAYCSVVLSSRQIGSPLVTSDASCAIIMNLPSLLKFEKSVRVAGDLLLNSSLIDNQVERSDLHVHRIPADELAHRCGNRKTANMVMLGAYISLSRVVQVESIIEAIPGVFGSTSPQFIKENRRALNLGITALQDSLPRLTA